MANAVIGALRVNLGLNTAEFENSANRARAQTSKFGAAIKTAFVGAAAAAAGALSGLAVALGSTLGAVDDIAKRAQISNTTFEDFQRLAFAARSVGIEGDKLADIFKDVNDRIGDFNQTGGGPMKDFFENIAPKVGLTADAFKNLSGPQALQLYYDSLKKAGANQQQMTFYLEAMASDATALIPLLEKGGEGFRKLGEGASVISKETGDKLRAFNQSMRDVGQAISDVALAAVASLAPALVIVGNGLNTFSNAIRGLIQYLPTVAEYAAVAGGALALMFAPAILSAVGSLIVAIGSGLVGAVQLLTAAIAANPLGALAIGLAAAVVAVYHFRDEIQKAIGTDVVQIAKDAANFVIGSFVAAFEDIKFVWQAFPNIIGSAVIGAANLVIKVVNDMVNGAKMAVNDLISAVNNIPGVSIDALATDGKAVKEIANPYSKALSSAVDQRNAAVSAALKRDYIGELGKAFEASTPAAVNFGKAMSGVNKELAAGSGDKKKKGGKSEAEKYSDIVDRANRHIASLKAEQEAIGMTEEAAAALRYETDLLNQAQQRGINLSASQKVELSGLAQAMASIEVATEKMRDALDFAKDATNGFLSDFRQGLANGEGVWKSFGNAAMNVLNKIIDKIQTEFVDALFSANSILGGGGKGGGGLFGGLFGGLGKIFGFARGGTILPGGAGGIDSQLVMFRKSPNERVDITKPGQTLAANSGGLARVIVGVDPKNGSIQPYVDNSIHQAAPGIQSGAVAQANRMAPGAVASYQASRGGGDWRNG
ncbi:hypothetical protein [Agrobacterium pusense]|uniref:hypothetical protein n=1 Tax=Agrobacterium pusense TaxID=648995 RepID=UPI000691B5C3|nr:hypothetical protein [Agrobacterium pusense]ANV24804.1 hypothetical protein BA939_13215 [Rhizobium sp. S41]QWW74494.1 hypothetical protein KP800_03085 [Agrobacterium pusense]